jgi:Ca2+:H+ antiporter
LLLVYVLYLLFQLISHSYLYESTPQHIIDEESVPGPAANWLDSSSDSDSSSSSSSSSSDSDSDSTDSEHSRGTMSRRVRRAMRRRRRSSRSSSSSSSKSKEVAQTSTSDADLPKTHGSDTASDGAREEVGEDGHRHKSKRYKRHRKHKSKNHSHSERRHDEQSQSTEPSTAQGTPAERGRNRTRRVDFALEVSEAPRNETTSRSRSRLRSIGLLPVVSSLAPTVFTQPLNAEAPPTPSGPVPRVRYGIRRTNSLPDRLSHQYARASGPMSPMLMPRAAVPPTVVAGEEEEEETQLSRTAAVILLLLSTGLVAVCAEFMVDSINGLVETSHVGEVFIGLIILPLVGNAAEHFTAITVAMKNKMDLAIGVAIGSSIQIALFITPLIVIIGWAANREMSLYFTLFETVCLFVSAFVANFLILDGRSNYLEGALLMAVYIIIGIIAFFYPDARDASSIGGPVG